MTCDPCMFCKHIYDDSDESVGLYGYGCDAEEEFEPGQGTPCPSFVPQFVSDGLFQQIADEDEARFWSEMEKEKEEEEE